MHCPVLKPDIVVVVDATLLDGVNVSEGMPDNGAFIVNTNLEPGQVRQRLQAKPTQKVFTVDATKIAIETIGRPMPNSPMVGALARVSGAVGLEMVLGDVQKSFGKKFSQKIIDGNLEATKRGFEGVVEG
jgi:pyruvate ferredoxin oxidoreductase gamma subunit